MKKFLNIILGLIPSAIYLLLQFVVFEIGFISLQFSNPMMLDEIVKQQEVWQVFSTQSMMIWSILGLLVFGLWYGGAFQNIERTPIFMLFTRRRALLLFIMSVCYQIVITFGIGLASIYFQDIVNKYIEGMDKFTSVVTVPLVLYMSIFAPITEELVFRGVTFNHFRRVMPFWAANFMQALMFGVFHMNIVQGIYAFLMGLVMGLVYKRYNSLYASIFVHICVNVSGSLLSVIPGMSPLLYLILLVLSFFGVVFSLIELIKKS